MVKPDKKSGEERLEYMVKWAEAQLSSEKDMIANLSNISAIINEHMEDISWAGFYIFKEGELILGPFQGKLACNRIALGRGVCGSAFMKNETLIVPDVHLFPGHIACDSESNSEIVIPIIKDNIKLGVLDIDSKHKNRFSDLEKTYLEKVVEEIKKYI
jgi:L-methionine (R)-S-oxide reductase